MEEIPKELEKDIKKIIVLAADTVDKAPFIRKVIPSWEEDKYSIKKNEYLFEDKEKEKTNIPVFNLPFSYLNSKISINFDSSVVILMYAFNSYTTFSLVTQYYQCIKLTKKNYKVILLGIENGDKKEVQTEDGKSTQKRQKFDAFYEISEKNAEKMNVVFAKAAELLLKNDGCCNCFK